MCDAGEARTRNPSISSQALYNCAIFNIVEKVQTADRFSRHNSNNTMLKIAVSLAPQGFWGGVESGYLFSGSLRALVFILAELGSNTGIRYPLYTRDIAGLK